MSTIKQERGAKILAKYKAIEIATGKTISLKRILKEAGYSLSTQKQGVRITKNQGFREELAKYETDFVPMMEKLMAKTLKALDEKDFNETTFRDARDLLDSLNKNIRLLKDLSTENLAMKAEIDLDNMTLEDAERIINEQLGKGK